VQPFMMCSVCKHFHQNDDVTVNECDAFPDGIPEEIFFGEFDHRQEFEGDDGIRFEAVHSNARRLVERIFGPMPTR